MGLPADQTYNLAWNLGVASAVMVALGYPGEIQDKPAGRWMWWFFAIIPWLTYPGVYIIKMVGLAGVTATAAEQIGYSVADVVAKAVFGVLIWSIASTKSAIEDEGGLLSGTAEVEA